MSSTAQPPARQSAQSDPDRPLNLAECVQALSERQMTSVELVERALRCIEATQSTLNAFRTVCVEAARAEAAEADRRLDAGERLPLLGVPVAVKDDIDIAGEPTAFGCAGVFEPRPEDCEMIKRLRAAGAVIVGKTNTPEMGLYPFTEGDAFGITRNPWSLEHTPGGSSGGAAAAVAAGIVPAAVGSDGAGSVRIPASWCNLVGIKPQRGRISTWPDRKSFNGISCLGPLTRTVADAALMLDVLSGHRENLNAPPAPAVSYSQAAAREPGRLVVAISLRHPYSAAPVRLDPEIRAGVLRLGTLLSELGHTVIQTNPRYGLMGLALIARGEAGVNEWLLKHVSDRSVLDRRTRETARLGSVLAKSVLPLALRAEPRSQRRVGQVFRGADVLLVPTTASPPLPITAAAGLGSRATQRLIAGACPYAWPWNVLGWPGISVPAGLTSAGLPFGAQLLGPANSEPMLLSLAVQLEQAEHWYERLPPFLAGAVDPR